MGRYKVMTGGVCGPDAGLLRRDARASAIEKVMEQCEKQTKKTPITMRPADLLKPEWEALRTTAMSSDGCNGSDEDVLTYAMFPKVAPKFFAERAQGTEECCERSDRRPRQPAQQSTCSGNGGRFANRLSTK